jgi:integrase
VRAAEGRGALLDNLAAADANFFAVAASPAGTDQVAVARSVQYGSAGLTFDQLEAAAPSHHYPRDRCPPLGVVLREEVERGRVERQRRSLHAQTRTLRARRLIAHRLASPWTRPGDPLFAATSGKPKAYRNVRRALETVGDELGLDLCTHDFRRSLASFLIVAARADEAAVTAVMGHANIETTRRIYAGDWRTAEERNALVLQLAEVGIGQ